MAVFIEDDEPIISQEFTLPNYTDSGLKEFTGEYYSPELKITYKAVLKNDKLTLTHTRANDIIIYASKSDIFSFSNIIVFNRDKNQQITGFRVSIGPTNKF